MANLNNPVIYQRRLADAESGYQQAIDYYNTLKLQFISEIRKDQSQSLQEASKWFLEECNKDLQDTQNSILDTDDGSMAELYEQIEQLAVNILSNNGYNQHMPTQQAIQNIRSKAKSNDDIRLYIKRAREEINQFMQYNEYINTALSALFQDFFAGAHPSQASMSGMLGMFKRALLDKINNGAFRTQITENSRLNGYKQLFRGYYSEVAKTRVINSVLERLGYSGGAAQIGELSRGGKQTVYDIAIGKGIHVTSDVTEEMLNDMDKIRDFFTFDIHETISTNELDNLSAPYGLQSKLWLLPDEIEQAGDNVYAQWYKIGDRADLLQSLGGGVLSYNYVTWERGWHNSVFLLSRVLTDIIGRSQVLYGTKNQFIWTSKLIQQMHRHNLYVSFYYKRGKEKDNGQPGWEYPATAEVAWQHPMYAYKNYMRMRIRQKQAAKK